MLLAAFIVSVLALVVSGVGLLYSRGAARASDRSAQAAEAADRRARTPRLSVTRTTVGPKDDLVIYAVRNDGPQDLDSVRVHRPRPPNGLKYPIAATGHDFADDDVELGPLGLNAEARFTLSCGAADPLPEFRVKIDCAAGVDRWTLTKLLDGPRPDRGPNVW